MLRQLLAPKRRSSSDERGFTVLELMVVVVIIALLATGLSLFIGNQRSLAVDAQTTSDIRNAANALERWQATSITNKVASSTDVTSNDNTFGIIVTPGTKLKVNPGPVAFSYTVCGYNPGGSAYKAADTSATYSSYNGGLSTKAGPCATSTQPGGGGGTVTPPVTPVDKGWTVSTIIGLAGSRAANVDGPTGTNRIMGNSSPIAVAVDNAGNLYFTSHNSNLVGIRKMTPDGNVSTLAGGPKASSKFPLAANDGQGGNARFSNVLAIALGADNNLYAMDGVLLRRIGLDGTVTSIKDAALGVTGSRMNMVTGSDGKLYLTDSINTGKSRIWKIDPTNGASSIFVGDSVGTADGTGTSAQFSNGLASITVSTNGNFYVVDGSKIRKITPAGVVTTLSTNPAFSVPGGITITPDGNLYTSDSGTVQQIDTVNVTSAIAGKMTASGSTDGLGTDSLFARQYSNANQVISDKNGTLYVYDTYNSTVRKLVKNT